MARFGQGFINALTKPSYGQGLMETAAGFGGLGGDLIKMKEEKQQEQQVSKIMQLANAAIANNDDVNLSRVAQQFAKIPGFEQQALEFAKAAQGIKQKRKEGQVASLEESGQQATQQAQKSRAVQVAGQKGDTDALVALRSGALDPAEYLKSLAKPQEKAKKGQTFASAGRYKDENGNLYAATEVRTRGSGVEIDYSPITPGAPENPVGKLEPVGGAYGETSGEMSDRRVGLAGAETRAEGFAKSQQEAIDNLPKIEVAIGNAERSLELLQQIKTGGFTTAIVRSAQQFFGVEPKNQAEFNLLAGKTVLDNLSNFPGAISEGERQYLEKLYQNLERSGGANQAILEVLLQEAQFYLADTQAKANASSYRDYLETRPTFSSVVPRDNRPKKVNFDDMKDK